MYILQFNKIPLSMREATDVALDVHLCSWRTYLHMANQHVITGFA